MGNVDETVDNCELLKKTSQDSEGLDIAEYFMSGVEITRYIFGLAKEGERVAVVLTASRIDYELETILKHLMIDFRESHNPLFASDRPLGTFSAKIALSYHLGLIDRNFRDSLTLVRKIRNEFAHCLHPQKLIEEPNRSRASELVRKMGSSRLFADLRPALAPIDSDPVFIDYCTSIAVILTSLKPLWGIMFDHEGNDSRKFLFLLPSQQLL